MRADASIRAQADLLTGLVREAFEDLGIRGEDAAAVADVLIDANLRGIESHGFNRVPTYMQRVQAGMAGGSERLRVVVDTGVMCRLDANHALGPAAAIRAIDLAIERGRAHGLSLVAVGNSTHFGTAGYYARRAALAGLIAIVITNAPATMAPYGARQRFLGTNPIAVSCPLDKGGPFVLDMSSSIVARGKIIRADRLGEPVPEGVAIDPDGRPATDAAAAVAGSMLPLGGPKGSNLALAIAMLCGVLAGSDFDDEMASMYEDHDRPQSVGHVFIVIDAGRLDDTTRIQRRLAGLIERLHGLPATEGVSEVLFAGEPEERQALQRRADGIRVPVAEVEAFIKACEACGAQGPAAGARRLLRDAAAAEDGRA